MSETSIPSDLPTELRPLAAMSQAELELEISKLRGVDPKSLTTEQCERAVALHRLLRLKTAGPPKAKGKSEPAPLEALAALDI